MKGVEHRLKNVWLAGAGLCSFHQELVLLAHNLRIWIQAKQGFYMWCFEECSVVRVFLQHRTSVLALCVYWIIVASIFWTRRTKLAFRMHDLRSVQCSVVHIVSRPPSYKCAGVVSLLDYCCESLWQGRFQQCSGFRLADFELGVDRNSEVCKYPHTILHPYVFSWRIW